MPGNLFLFSGSNLSSGRASISTYIYIVFVIVNLYSHSYSCYILYNIFHILGPGNDILLISCSTHPGVICQVWAGEDTNFCPQIKTWPAFSNSNGGVLEVSPTPNP